MASSQSKGQVSSHVYGASSQNELQHGNRAFGVSDSDSEAMCISSGDESSTEEVGHSNAPMASVPSRYETPPRDNLNRSGES